MAGGIYLRRNGELVRMDQQVYASEADLQELIALHPELLSADGAAHRWLLIAREFGIASEPDGNDRWSVDHLFIDEQAVPTLVEVKRSTDTRIRREVVGQMLDYAANALSHWSAESIRAHFEAMSSDTSPEAGLTAALGGGIDPDQFWSQVQTNLAAGRMRLMFVADVIPNELRAIVEFLNQQMAQVEVLALELRQYVDADGEQQTLVPSLVGETQAARQAKGQRRERREWDRDSWLLAFRDRRGDSEARVVERLLRWADEQEPPLSVTFGSTSGAGVKVGADGVMTLFTVFPGYNAGSVELPFTVFARTPPFDRPEARRQIQRRLNEIPGARIDDDKLEKYPSVPVPLLVEPSAFERFASAIAWLLHEARASRRAVSSSDGSM